MERYRGVLTTTIQGGVASFRMMKTRWRSTLFRALEVRPSFAPLVIASCASLHNVCLENGDMLEPDADAEL